MQLRSPFPKETYQHNAQIYRILANPKRLEILNILREYGPLPVSELREGLNISKANLSQHLSILRTAGLIQNVSDDHAISYKITDPRIVEPCRIISMWNTT